MWSPCGLHVESVGEGKDLTRGLKTSVIAFDIAQFFLSINHDALMAILRKQGFPPLVVNFFASIASLPLTTTCTATASQQPHFPIASAIQHASGSRSGVVG